MKTFAQFQLTEADIATKVSKLIILLKKKGGDSFYKKLSSEQARSLLKGLAKISGKDNSGTIDDFIYEVEKYDIGSEAYSQSIGISTGQVSFSLFAKDGELRVGSGGDYTSSKVLNDMDFDELIAQVVEMLPSAVFRVYK